NRIAGDDRLFGVCTLVFGQEAARDRRNPCSKRLVGAPHDGILFMDDGGDATPGGGIERRQRGITAESDDDLRLDAVYELRRLTNAAPDGEEGLRQGDRIFRAEGGGCDGMHLGRGKMAGEP